jgi:hypothetical protein
MQDYDAMMLSFFKKPKITFDCLVPGVERIMPMIPARELKHLWVQKALQEFADIRKNPTWNMQRIPHTVKCPGIFSLQRHGWVMRTWQDITIETYGDGTNFKWSTPINQKDLHPSKVDYVGANSQEQFANYQENWRPETLRTVLKIQSPWRCVVPKGYYLLEMAVPYLDEIRFTTISGFFDSDHGLAQLNPQFLCHVPQGKTLIKAGTPIAQYILVPKEKVGMEINVLGSISDEGFYNMANNTRFATNYGEVRKLYKDKK